MFVQALVSNRESVNSNIRNPNPFISEENVEIAGRYRPHLPGGARCMLLGKESTRVLPLIDRKVFLLVKSI
jgi:hypothetical protein